MITAHNTTETTKPVGLRCPERLLEHAKEAAKKDGRSLSNLLILALRKHLESVSPGLTQ